MKNALSIQNLSKVYSDDVQALSSVTFDVEQGDFFALLGPNGAGKSTLISSITSLVKKTSGKIFINEIDIDKNFDEARKYIGIVPQEYNFSLFSQVEHVLVNQAGFYGIPAKVAKERAKYYLNKLDIYDKRASVSRDLSGGMKRRMMIARALIHEPKILILDEPTAGVDIEVRRAIWHFLEDLNAEGITIILTTHYLEEAEKLCRNIAFINHGRIIENTSMISFLSQLETESFLLYLSEPIDHLPKLSNYEVKLIDSGTVEAVLLKTQDISHLFQELHKHNIFVSRLRNKANRLEELFLQMTVRDRSK